MDFSYSETQLVIAGMARDVLRSASPESAWKALAQAGLLSLSVPSDLGGEGLGVVETAIVLTELGRRAVLTPAIASLALGCLPIAHLGSPSQRKALLSPGLLLTTALNPATARPTLIARGATPPPTFPSPAISRAADIPAGSEKPIESGATAPLLHAAEVASGAMASAGLRSLGDFRAADAAAGEISGVWIGVPYAGDAHRILLPGRDCAAVIDPAHAWLDRTVSSSGLPEYTVKLASAPVESVVAGDVYPLVLAGVCAMADGLLAGALELTTAHLGTRKQFGKELATFQSAAGQIADVYIASRTLHLIAMSLAWRLDTARDTHSDVEAARAWLAQEALPALRTCHHLHGGIGLDVTYPLHRYYSLMKDLIRYVHRPF
jgi:hypothetical protein